MPHDSGDDVRIVVAETTSLAASLLSDGLRRCRRLQVVGSASSSAEVLREIARHRPQVALVSGNLGNETRTGFEITRELYNSHTKTRVVILLDSSEREQVIEAFRAGARGVFCRSASLSQLRRCIFRVNEGQIWANTAELNLVLDVLVKMSHFKVIDLQGRVLLSNREEEVLHCVAEGLTNRDVALKLGISEHTVKNYLFRIFDKLGVSNRVEMIMYALNHMAPMTSTGIDAGFNGGSAWGGVPPANWWRRVADRGFSLAQYYLGGRYRDGVGVPKDLASAYAWFLAAEQTASEIHRAASQALQSLTKQMTAAQINRAERQVAQAGLGEVRLMEPKRPPFVGTSLVWLLSEALFSGLQTDPSVFSMLL